MLYIVCSFQIFLPSWLLEFTRDFCYPVRTGYTNYSGILGSSPVFLTLQKMSKIRYLTSLLQPSNSYLAVTKLLGFCSSEATGKSSKFCVNSTMQPILLMVQNGPAIIGISACQMEGRDVLTVNFVLP